jgi:hypothetical protein
MSARKLEELIRQLENYLECWKQFNQYLSMARSKKFQDDDEAQFLEVKSVLTQELELILARIETPNPSKEEVLSLISGVTSIRFASELPENSLRAIENNWHKIYIAWQSLLGQLKVQQQQSEKKGLFASLFRK